MRGTRCTVSLSVALGLCACFQAPPAHLDGSSGTGTSSGRATRATGTGTSTETSTSGSCSNPCLACAPNETCTVISVGTDGCPAAVECLGRSASATTGITATVTATGTSSTHGASSSGTGETATTSPATTSTGGFPTDDITAAATSSSGSNLTNTTGSTSSTGASSTNTGSSSSSSSSSSSGGPVDAGFAVDAICWNECDQSQNTDCGMWLWSPSTQTFTGLWLNGSEANIVVDEYDSQIVLDRSDYAGGATGLTAHYVGTRTGNTVSGTVMWTFNGNTTQGSWSAHWNPGQGCELVEDAGPGGSIGPPPSGWSLGPMTWDECESSGDAAGCSTWTWSDALQQFSTTLPDGGSAAYTLAGFDSVQVVVDLDGGAGTTARYVGVRSGNSAVGSVTYWWHDGGAAGDTWSASW